MACIFFPLFLPFTFYSFPSPLISHSLALFLSPFLSSSLDYYRYGNLFAWADDDVIQEATVILNPPTVTNLIAMEV
jgi:hypothetical protein